MRKYALAAGGAFAAFAVVAAYFALAPYAVAQADPPSTASGSAEGSSGGDRSDADEAPVDNAPENPFPGRSPAPSLEGGFGWLNTSGPIDLKDLRGKVVLLDFWTFCCINCIHVLPDLEYLENKFDKELVVIGVHSAKFDNEKETEAIRDAIMRYEIAHPVINDADMVVWRKFGARAWPTLVVIDPEGNYCGYVSGEGNRNVLEDVISKLVAYHEAKGTLDRTPLHFDLERYDAEPTPLRYPGKLVADADRNRLFIADTGHNRIVMSALDGSRVETIGSGAIGRKDGSFAEAQFDHPHGLALFGETLYVADTENHLIRKVDLASKTVSTLAGTGHQGRFREGGGPVATTNLNSPWDLLVHDGVLYIAMAGPHQIWSHALGSDEIGVFAGSGREDVIDGTHADSALAQPSGLASDGEALYVCDSEGSAIRRVPFDVSEEVSTVAGPSDMPLGRTLFEFGDIDGVGDTARFQHPLGIAWRGDTLFIADSYNHKLKTVSLAEESYGLVKSFAGGPDAGEQLDPIQFSEPAGLAVAANNLFVADTNNHRIVRIDLRSKKSTKLEMQGLTPPTPARPETDLASEAAEIEALPVEPSTVAISRNAKMVVELSLPEGFKLNEAYPSAVVASSRDPQGIVREDTLGRRIKAAMNGSTATFSLPLTGKAGSVELLLAFSYGYCREGAGGVCKVGRVRWKLPLTVAETGASEVRLTASPDDAANGR